MNRFLERGAEDAAAHIKYYYEKTGDSRISVFDKDEDGIEKWQREGDENSKHHPGWE